MKESFDLSPQDNYFDFPKGDIEAKQQSTQCPLCKDKINQEPLFSIGNCQHFFCSKCLQDKVNLSIRQEIPITCPIDQCQTSIDTSGNLFKKLSNITQQRIISGINNNQQKMQRPKTQNQQYRMTMQAYRKSFAKKVPQNKVQRQKQQKHQKSINQQKKEELNQLAGFIEPKLLIEIAEQEYLIAKKIVEQREKNLRKKNSNKKQRKLVQKRELEIQEVQFNQDLQRQINSSQKESKQNMQPLINKFVQQQRQREGQRAQAYIHRKGRISKRRMLIYPVILPLGILLSLAVLLLGFFSVAVLVLSILFGYLGSIASVIMVIKSLIYDQDQDEGVKYLLCLIFCLFLLITNKIINATLKEAIPACFKQSKKMILKTVRFPILKEGS